MDQPEERSDFQSGHADIDLAMASIAGLEATDLATHAAAFEHVHEVLKNALATPSPAALG